MASFQRVALFLLFDAAERDLVRKIDSIPLPPDVSLLSPEEIEKAAKRIENRNGELDTVESSELLASLDLGDKLAVLNRHKSRLSHADQNYLAYIYPKLLAAIPARNAVMHGRPVTATEYSLGFALAADLVGRPSFWPELAKNYREFNDDTPAFIGRSIRFLDEHQLTETLNNLPAPDYDDTGFMPRSTLEKELKRKILGRHPVVTVLGDGGNGKTALTLHVLYGLIDSEDHDFDAIVWVSAKSASLSGKEIVHIEGAITDSLGIFTTVADLLEPGSSDPYERVLKLLAENKILLVIDNLETVLDQRIQDFAADIPGQSKLVLTSRVPLGGDLTVTVDGFSEEDAKSFFYRLAEAHSSETLKRIPTDKLSAYFRVLDRKPLLIKWFALAVESGLSPDSVTRSPDIALQFCMENVLARLTEDARLVASTMTLVPHELSITVLEHITSLDAARTEKSISELFRHGLVEPIDTLSLERRYRLRPFVRSYVAQFLSLDAAEAQEIVSRFREVESAFQFERGGQQSNPSDPRSFVVRTPSEAIAARKLRNAITLAFRNKFDEAQAEVDELKVTSPQYFEVWRADAFVAYRTGDYMRARSGYEAAIALDPNQPQLHFFFGQHLMRVMSDFDGAKAEFEEAIRQLPDHFDFLMNAARNEFFRYDFKAAEHFIYSAWAVPRLTEVQRTKLTDINAQLFVRRAEHQISGSQFENAKDSLSSLATMIQGKEQFDAIHATHLRKAISHIEKVIRAIGDYDDERLAKLASFIEGLPVMPTLATDSRPPTANQRYYSGQLKPYGRTETFGFLRDHWGEEVYLARSSVTPDLWNSLCAGVPVMYEIDNDARGRTFAKNVTRV